MHLVSRNLFCLQRVYMCVSPPLRQLLTGGVIWQDILTPYDWLKKFYSFYMAVVFGIISRHYLSIDVGHTVESNLISKLVLYKPLLSI